MVKPVNPSSFPHPLLPRQHTTTPRPPLPALYSTLPQIHHISPFSISPSPRPLKLVPNQCQVTNPPKPIFPPKWQTKGLDQITINGRLGFAHEVTQTLMKPYIKRVKQGEEKRVFSLAYLMSKLFHLKFPVTTLVF